MIIRPFQLLFGLMDLLRRSLVGTLMLGGNISAFSTICSEICSAGSGREGTQGGPTRLADRMLEPEGIAAPCSMTGASRSRGIVHVNIHQHLHQLLLL
jgi:hypothetical protein